MRLYPMPKSAGDPKIKERMELEVDVNKLSVLRSAYKNDHYRLQDDINVNLPHEIAKKENLLTALQHDSATFAANHAQSVGDTFPSDLWTYVHEQRGCWASTD